VERVWIGHQAETRRGRTNAEAFADIEAANSDGDNSLPPSGWSNLLEIQYNGQPGWTYGMNNMYDGNGTMMA